MEDAPLFSYDALEAVVRRFAREVPGRLAAHPATADLAVEVERLQLAEALDARFTVAVVGQMRVGKSTLLNALIGRALSPVGVNETTATVNWFRYGTGPLCDAFRVHWRDGSTEDLPLDAVADWVGQSENARQTRRLDFFADSDFLRTANLVDTPGTRSVIADHQARTDAFLAERLETESLGAGARADAVVYALNPVAKEDDDELLRLFGERTRLPGASAYNSIAVVQKWEHLGPDPLAEVERKCHRLRQHLQGKVAEVLPTSGLLATACREAPAAAWAALARLAAASSPEALGELRRSAVYFRDDVPGAALDAARRAELLAAFGWPSLPFLLGLAARRGLDTGPALRRAAWEASGIDRLKALLQTRFFALAALIKAGTALRRAWTPCDVALLRLRHLAHRGEADLARGRRALDALTGVSPPDLAADVRAYVADALDAAERDLGHVQALRRALDALKHQAESNFRLLEADIDALHVLDTEDADALDEDEVLQLRRLFGERGTAPAQRLGLGDPPSGEGDAPAHPIRATNHLLDLHEHWSRRRAAAHGPLRRLCDHALERIENLLDAAHAAAPAHEPA